MGKFAAEYNRVFGAEAPCYRITHGHDPVVHVPPISGGYVHVNTEVYFDDKGSDYRICTKTEDPNGSNKHSNVPWDLFYTGEHCGAPAFGDGFDICTPGCSAPKSNNFIV